MYAYVHEACGTSDQITECGECLGVWCDRCDPAHGPLCPWCHGMGYSTAAILQPVYRQANHVLNNDGYPVQESRRRRRHTFDLPLHRTEAGYPNCATCDGGGCLDCTDPA